MRLGTWAMANPAEDRTPALTPRQLDILRLIAQGSGMKEIAAELDLPVRTIEDHKPTSCTGWMSRARPT